MTKVLLASEFNSAIPVYDLTVFIGRFRPLHNGHLKVIREALRVSKALTILVGSCGEPRSVRNPFTFEEVHTMIRASLLPEEQDRVFVQALSDTPYNDTLWAQDVQTRVGTAVRGLGLENAKVALVGHSKDHTSYYLRMFPQWAAVEVDNYEGLSATPIRDFYFGTMHPSLQGWPQEVSSQMPEAVRAFLKDFTFTPDYDALVKEYDFVNRYKDGYAVIDATTGKPRPKYPPIFTTVDAVVVQSAHVLLIQRKEYPGKGLWALPGGYLEAHERISSAWVRELREETKLKVPEDVLRGSLVATDIFDDPHRDPRGRMVTHAFLVALKPGELPQVRAGSDAKAVRWTPIAEIKRSELYADHFDIIHTLLPRLADKQTA